MKRHIRFVLAGTAALVVAAGVLVVGAGAANAAVTPGWEPDANAQGGITLYNAQGAVVTGGTLTGAPSIAYASATAAGHAGDTKAQLYIYTPQQGVAPASWNGDSLTGQTPFPNTAAPAPINGLTVPVATGTTGDLTVGDVVDEFPNTSTAAGYQNLYELRLYSTPGGLGAGSYYRVDIEVNTTAGTWTVVYPVGATATTTTLTASPESPAPHATSVPLTSRVSPAAAGTVRFTDGSTDLGAGTYNAATGIATLTITPSDGQHSFTAQFTSADTAAYQSSTSTALSYSVTSAATATATVLSASPASPAPADSSGNATVTLTATVTPTGLDGSLHVFDGSTDLGVVDSYTATTGIGTTAVVLSGAGSPHFLTATFMPVSVDYAKSTSAILSYTVVLPNAGTANIPVQADNTTPPYAGNLSLQVASGTTVNLVQVDASTDAGHPAQAGDATKHRRAWVFTGSLGGVAVVDTRPGEPGWTVTGQATAFVNGPVTIPASNLGWVPTLVTTGSDAEGSVAAGGALASSLAQASSTGLSQPGKLASAAAANGLGAQNLGSTLELRIPDTSPTGSYTSTLTLTLVSP